MPLIRFVIVLCAGLALCAAPRADADQSRPFRSPTGNIGCAYWDKHVRCDVTGGIVPVPPQPQPCEVGTWAGGYRIGATGSARAICTSDTVLGVDNVLPYGKSWSAGGVTCRSARVGVTCTNRSRHGFFVSKGASHTF